MTDHSAPAATETTPMVPDTKAPDPVPHHVPPPEPQHHHDHGHHHHHHHHHEPLDDPPPYLYSTEAQPDSHLNDPNYSTFHGRRRRHDRTGSQTPLASIFQGILGTLFMIFFVVIAFRVLDGLTRRPYPYNVPSTGLKDSNCEGGHHLQVCTPSDPALYPNHSFTRHETFLPINGHFDLYDYLELTTVTGAIDVFITPHPGTTRATLKVRSVTGSVRIRLSEPFHQQITALTDDITHAALSRPFDTSIHTNTGAITATWLTGSGSTTEFSSQTGTLMLDLLATNTGPDDPVTVLRTSTQTSFQNVAVRPLSVYGDRVASLSAEHSAKGSGGLNVAYPAEWEGWVEASVVGSGNIDVQGRGLVVDEESSWRVRAHRGEADVGVRVSSIGGGVVNFAC